MNYEDTHIGTVFIAPASYLIEELEEQEKEIFKNRVFQYDNMVCGIVDQIDSKRGYVWATFKVPDKNYNYPIVTLSIDCYGVDLSKFHCVKSVQRIDFYHFLKIKEQDIIDIIKNKDYD